MVAACKETNCCWPGNGGPWNSTSLWDHPGF
jgi:hypothetical protein